MRVLKWSASTILTCPCALVTSCPVAPCRFDKVFPNTCDPAMDPMAAAAATWLASGFSCWGQRNHYSNLPMFNNTKQEPHTLRLIAMARPEQANRSLVCAVQWKGKCCLSFSSLRSVFQNPMGKAIEGWEEWCNQHGRYEKVAVLPL